MIDTTRFNISTLALRLGLSFVFIYFGISQLHNPGQWVNFVPPWLGSTDASHVQFVLMNGWFELISAALLILGAYTRIAALLLAFHLFGIASVLGVNPIGIRDIGLAISTLVLANLGSGMFSLDYLAMKARGEVVQ